MKTILSDLTNFRESAGFVFAGFQFPKHLWSLPKDSFAKRLARRNPVTTGEYIHGAKPGCKVKSFYLDSDFMPSLRWEWCDEICDSIRHTGWYCDSFQDSKIRGIVIRLPHNRGFLAGWSMGEGMISGIEYVIYDDEREAAWAADSLAEKTAEKEREFQESQEEEEDNF